MDQRIKAEDKINRLIFDHVERASIVHMVGQILETPEAGPTGVNAAWGDVDQRQAGGIRLQELGPAAISGSNLQNIFRRNKIRDARKDAAVPLSMGPTPAHGPLIARQRPLVIFIPNPAVLINAVHPGHIS